MLAAWLVSLLVEWVVFSSLQPRAAIAPPPRGFLYRHRYSLALAASANISSFLLLTLPAYLSSMGLKNDHRNRSLC